MPVEQDRDPRTLLWNYNGDGDFVNEDRGVGSAQAPRASTRWKESQIGAYTRTIVFRYMVLLLLLGLVIVGTALYPGFLSPTNLRNILSQNAPLGLIAVGATFVIIGGGFDISVGSTFALTATLYAGMAIGHPTWLAAMVAIFAGLVCGAANGVLVTVLRVNAFIATLASSSVILGVARLYSHSEPQLVRKAGFDVLGRGSVGPIRISIVVIVAVFAVGALVLHRTVYGRSVFAVGGNYEASRLSGIRVRVVQAGTYVITGFLCALAGMMMASRLGVGQADFGPTMALDSIAVVVIGGASLMGGAGSMWRTAAGLLILATLTNVFNSLAIDPSIQLVTKGAIIAGAVAFDSFARSRTRAGVSGISGRGGSGRIRGANGEQADAERVDAAEPGSKDGGLDGFRKR
jgi:ribose transport system permease protein